ncbi:hypothetical protein AXF42_Ash005550 [Apostasia shenzhenica]|uniref:Uncharacterized protein n=1 Tax=Apostasia shenzhenica TaxID=1088818 RepID=A0A2I0B789_9ASPA|nr:hypothetical protein AXF42_Ash005550 [Apostasia shenzhenica]
MEGEGRRRRMERWLPLFQILLHSPSPEGEASFWLQQHHHLRQTDSPAAPSLSTSAFLSLLLSPASFVLPLSSASSSSSTQKPRIWMQTLPFAVQCRILSLLSSESPRFCPRRLRFLAAHILDSDLPSSSDHPAFWVRRAARDLFDVLPRPVPDSAIADEEEEQNPHEDEFDSFPHWLEDAAKTTTPLLPWLPLPSIPSTKSAGKSHVYRSKEPVTINVNANLFSESESCEAPPRPLPSQAREKAAAVNAKLLASDLPSEAKRLADEIRQLCLESGSGNELMVLDYVKPWEVNDENLSVLLLHLVIDTDFFSKNWPAYVLCSTVLPKLLSLRTPASRALLSSTISFCMQHQTAAVDAILFPLILHKEGVNGSMCDVLMRIVKECLHPVHVSAFCQRLLCGEGNYRRIICLSCHQELISDEVVWTDSLFNLFQHILNQDVYITSDTAERLAAVILVMASKFSKSLKFSNFLLSFVMKCNYAVKDHFVQLRDAAEKTNTFMTKSILSKLSSYC